MKTTLPVWEGTSWTKSWTLGHCKAKELWLQRFGKTPSRKDKDITGSTVSARA